MYRLALVLTLFLDDGGENDDEREGRGHKPLHALPAK